MQLSPPRQWTFYLAVVLWVIALLANWLPQLSADSMGFAAGYVLALIAGLLLILGNMMNNL